MIGIRSVPVLAVALGLSAFGGSPADAQIVERGQDPVARELDGFRQRALSIQRDLASPDAAISGRAWRDWQRYVRELDEWALRQDNRVVEKLKRFHLRKAGERVRRDAGSGDTITQCGFRTSWGHVVYFDCPYRPVRPVDSKAAGGARGAAGDPTAGQDPSARDARDARERARVAGQRGARIGQAGGESAAEESGADDADADAAIVLACPAEQRIDGEICLLKSGTLLDAENGVIECKYECPDDDGSGR